MIIICEDELQKLKRLDPSESGDAIIISYFNDVMMTS